MKNYSNEMHVYSTPTALALTTHSPNLGPNIMPTMLVVDLEIQDPLEIQGLQIAILKADHKTIDLQMHILTNL